MWPGRPGGSPGRAPTVKAQYLTQRPRFDSCPWSFAACLPLSLPYYPVILNNKKGYIKKIKVMWPSHTGIPENKDIIFIYKLLYFCESAGRGWPSTRERSCINPLSGTPPRQQNVCIGYRGATGWRAGVGGPPRCSWRGGERVDVGRGTRVLKAATPCIPPNRVCVFARAGAGCAGLQQGQGSGRRSREQ